MRLLLLCAALVAALTLPAEPLARALLALLAAAWHLSREPFWPELRVGDDAWWLRDARGRWHRATLLDDTLRHRWLVVLRLRLDGGRRLSLPLPFDSLSAGDHSALRRLLGGELSRPGR